MHLLRNGLQAVDMLAWFMAITLIPLAEATALTFASPLFATLFAVLLLGERIRWRRVAALIIGFLGVLVAVRPGLVAVDTGTLLVLVSAVAI
jgi:drug/metabolite transporter (DMT)-like permease